MQEEHFNPSFLRVIMPKFHAVKICCCACGVISPKGYSCSSVSSYSILLTLVSSMIELIRDCGALNWTILSLTIIFVFFASSNSFLHSMHFERCMKKSCSSLRESSPSTAALIRMRAFWHFIVIKFVRIDVIDLYRC